MARQRTIVGLGEAVLVEHPDRSEPAGLACGIALQAARFGHRGVVISRVGQDDQARMLVDLLSERGVEINHVQWDPDLPTGRAIVRPIGGRVDRWLESRAAFDNLQGDFDLEDVAQQTDAVVYGMLTRRGGQTRSEENRFVSACDAAIKLFDLTNHPGPRPDRGHAGSGLGYADGAVVTPAILDAVVPGVASADGRDAVDRLMRDFELSFVMLHEDDETDGARLRCCTAEENVEAHLPRGRPSVELAIVAFLHAVLRGRSIEESMAFVEDATRRDADRPGEPFPDEWTVTG